MKLSVKISTLVAIAAFVPAVTVLGYTLWILEQEHNETVLTNISHDLSASANILTSEFKSAQREVEIYAQMPAVKSMQPLRFLPYLKQEIERHRGRYEKFIIGRTDGHFYNTSGGNPKKGMLRTFDDTNADSKPQSIESRDYWLKTVALNSQQNAVSIISNPMISFTTAARQVVIASSIIDNQQLKGMIGVAVDWQRIVSLLERVKHTYFEKYPWQPKIFITAQDGTFWYHWDNSLIAKLAKDEYGQLILNSNGQRTTQIHSIHEQEHASLAQAISQYANSKQNYIRFKDDSGQNHYLFSYPISYANYNIGLIVPEHEAVPFALDYLRIILMFLISFAAVSIVALSFHRQILSQPLQHLMTHIRKLRDGHYEQQISLNTHDEFSQVAATLGEMSTAIIERETALKSSEARFECAMLGTNDGLWDWNLKTNDVYYSPRWCEMLGYRSEDITHQLSSFIGLIHPDDNQYCQQYIDKYFRENLPHFTMRFRMVHKQGYPVYVLSRAFLVKDEQTGEPLRLIGTHVDITDEKLHEQQINELNAELEQRVKERTQELETANKLLEELSLKDSLTELGNRRHMENVFTRMHSSFLRHQIQYSALLLDIDYFKMYNDHYGHEQGDKALRQVAQLIQHAIRVEDSAFRYGGEEFLVLLPNTPIEKAQETAERIRNIICSAQIEHQVTELGMLTVSIGVASSNAKELEWQLLVARADQHLYQAKAAGRNTTR